MNSKNPFLMNEDSILKTLNQLESLSAKIKFLKRQKELTGWLTTEKASKFLKVTPRIMQNYRDQGTISFSQIGSKVFYKLSDLQHHLENLDVIDYKFNSRRA